MSDPNIVNEEDNESIVAPPLTPPRRGVSLQDLLRSRDRFRSQTTPPVTTSVSSSRFRSLPRTDDEISTHRPVVRQTERPSEAKDLQRLRQAATTKLSNSFSLLSLDDSSSQLADTYDVSMRIVEFEKLLFKFDMKDVFSLLKTSSSPPVNLLSLFAGVTEGDVRSSNEFYNKYGQDYDLQNLHWSAELLENSCDQDLLDKISERLISVPHLQRGGPLSFFFAMEEITSSTTDAVRTMERRVTSLKLTDFQGENVSTVVSQLRSAISRLTFLGKLPHDIVPKLLDVFQSSSVPAFNDVFKFVALQNKIGQATTLTHAKILVLASTTFRELVEKNEWSGNKKSSSLVCFKCGKDGHIIKDCPDSASASASTTTKSWTRVKPTNGNSSLTKHDKTWYRCDKCGSWNLTHTTDKHVKKPTSEKPTSATSSSTPSSSANVSSSSVNGSSASDAVQSLNFSHLILDGLQKT